MTMSGEWAYMPMEKATTPREGARVYTDRWWAHVPGKGLVFYKYRGGASPQCNHNRAIVEDIAGKRCPGAEVIFMPVVFR